MTYARLVATAWPHRHNHRFIHELFDQPQPHPAWREEEGPMLHTPICELFAIPHPIISAPMGGAPPLISQLRSPPQAAWA